MAVVGSLAALFLYSRADSTSTTLALLETRGAPTTGSGIRALPLPLPQVDPSC